MDEQEARNLIICQKSDASGPFMAPVVLVFVFVGRCSCLLLVVAVVA